MDRNLAGDAAAAWTIATHGATRNQSSVLLCSRSRPDIYWFPIQTLDIIPPSQLVDVTNHESRHQLEITDTKVAERAGLAQTRYAAYAVDKYEPDLATLLRICRVLRTTPNDLLGWTEEAGDDDGADLRRRIAANLAVLAPETLGVVDAMTAALARRALGEGE